MDDSRLRILVYSLEAFPDDEEYIDLTMTRADHIPELTRFSKLNDLTIR